MSNVRRVYVEKKPAYAVQAKELKHEISSYLGIKSATNVRVLIRYDVENISDEVFEKACRTVFAEPPVDDLYLEKFEAAEGAKIFSVEYLPGQFDQRADSAVQCVQFLDGDAQPIIRSATTYVIEGNVTDEEFDAIKHHCINPVDSRETGLEKPETLVTVFPEPEDVKIFDGFKDMPEADLKALYDSLNLAMTFKDFQHIQNYFKNEEKRDPSMTEIRVLDTYWSDHCRHTTFSTELTDVKFDEGDYKEPIVKTYEKYLADREVLYKGRDDKFVCLMDLALMAMKKLKSEGKLADQEESDEINACSIVVPVDVDGKEEEWLINFKNETHNHPTEIEPFGGAATCLGGAIRDPLSGRTYVYQAMRVTGAADPTVSVKETLKGKLPQKKLVRSAAHGYSSYGNQIGLATGYVKEVYHPDYVAKRMEIGAVMGAAPRRAVIRENSDPGDIIILLGGRTGRDGIGGATGSSKVHTEASIEVCGAEVQKGNAPTERKIQRMFRREEVSHIIKKCNDFGAGGVSVAIGELADGLRVDLDKVPKKYAGLDGTELAISESQERMAVVIDPKDVDKFMAYAEEENLEATCVAEVTEDPRLVMHWRGKEIVNISRAFLDTNGAHQETDVIVGTASKADSYFEEKADVADVKAAWLKDLADLNVCSQKGLVEMFDASIGAGSVFMPFGGKYQLTPTQSMVAKLPVLKGKTDTVTMMSYGFNPYLSNWSPYHGAAYAVVESVAKIVAAGGDFSKIRFTFQEYFKRMTEDAKGWGEPMSALLGAYTAQIGFGLPSIGGKDSMSGSFLDKDVPPTLISFAIAPIQGQQVLSPEFKAADHPVYLFRSEDTKSAWEAFHALCEAGKVKAAWAVESGLAEAVMKMSFGNRIGFQAGMENVDWYVPMTGAIVAELSEDINDPCAVRIGETNEAPFVALPGEAVSIDELLKLNDGVLESVYPTKAGSSEEVKAISWDKRSIAVCKHKVARPKAVIPVFPGTNCEYDTAKACLRAGIDPEIVVVRNLSTSLLSESAQALEQAIRSAQMVVLPGGFSGGDEPEGSGKFIASFLRSPALTDAIHDLLKNRDGLMLGICNGFQALVKLGLVPFGEIREMDDSCPTLTYNLIGRHQSRYVTTRVASVNSPWMIKSNVGDLHTIPISHGEGRFVAPQSVLEQLIANGQVATQYVDLEGNPSMDIDVNPNGSLEAIEGIFSPDGRVFGKMGHLERRGPLVGKNIPGEKHQPLFESGAEYFK